MKINNSWLFGMLLSLLTLNVSAWDFYGDNDTIYLSGAAYTHFSSSDDHEGPPVLISAEIQKASRLFYGLSLFNNSFGQFSQYLYIGQEFRFDKWVKGLRSKISVGLIHGYKDEFQDKIPLNNYGIAPAIIPGIGYQVKDWGFDMYLMGNSGLLFSVGRKF